MHILMIAPQPFFEARGTPFSELHRIRALIDLGHTVDLVTYPFGRDVALDGLRITRAMRPPFVRRVRIGPSLAKIPLDLAVAFSALRLAVTRRYDAVHSHEEGGVVGVLLARWLGVPHLYDMHSSLPQQLDNFQVGRSRVLRAVARWAERLMVRGSRAVVVICPQLEEVVRAIDPAASPVLIENAPGSGEAPTAGAGAGVREELGLGPHVPLAVYTGTFEAYQGLDLLFAAATLVARARPDARVLMVGGEPGQVEQARRQARAAGAGEITVFAGHRPAEDIPRILDAADCLVSPRSSGTNTPLKIYQYLRSGRPIVATRLLTHTQVLDDEVAILTAATPRAFADGLLRAFGDPESARRVGERARALAERKYSYEAYLARTREACARLEAGSPAPAAGEAS